MDSVLHFQVSSLSLNNPTIVKNKTGALPLTITFKVKNSCCSTQIHFKGDFSETSPKRKKKHRLKAKWPRSDVTVGEPNHHWSWPPKWKKVLWSDSPAFSNRGYFVGVRAGGRGLSISNSHICDGSGSKGPPGFRGQHLLPLSHAAFFFFLVSSFDTFLWVTSFSTFTGLVLAWTVAAPAPCFPTLTSALFPPLSFVFFSFPGVPVF